jgi:hypothetical protein
VLVVRVRERHEAFVSTEPWFGRLVERFNDHECAVERLWPWRLKPGHAMAMLSSHDEVVEVDLASAGRLMDADLYYFVVEADCSHTCKVCEARCIGGEVSHGKGCYHLSPEGGGIEVHGCEEAFEVWLVSGTGNGVDESPTISDAEVWPWIMARRNW